MGGSAGAEARKTRRTQHPEDRKNPTIERHRHSGKIAASGAVPAETRRRTLKNQTKNDGNSFSIDLLFPKREAQNFGGQRQKQRTGAQRRQEAMDPGGKRVRTDSPSTDSQRDGPKTRKSAKRDSKSSENSEVEMRFEAQNPQIRNLHRTPRRRKLRAQRAHGRKPHREKGGRVAAWEQPKGNVQNRKPKPRKTRTAKAKGWNASQGTEPVGIGKDRGSGKPETQFAEDTPMG